jgi:hypothetical protein
LSTNGRPHHNRLRVKVLPSAKIFLRHLRSLTRQKRKKEGRQNAGLPSWNAMLIDQ